MRLFRVAQVFALTLLAVMIQPLGANQGQAVAQDAFVRLQNRWKPDQFIHIERGRPESGSIQPGWFSAMWILEPVAGQPGSTIRIRNRWKPNQYLNVEQGPLESTSIQPGWWSAMWIMVPVGGDMIRLQNRWKPTEFLNIERGMLVSSSIETGWWSAMWYIQRL